MSRRFSAAIIRIGGVPPARGSAVTAKPEKDCRLNAGEVSASHTRSAGAAI